VHGLDDLGVAHRGQAGVRRWLEEALEPWERVHIHVEEMTATDDDQLLLGVLMTTRGRGSGVETELASGKPSGSRMARSPGGRVHIGLGTRASKPSEFGDDASTTLDGRCRNACLALRTVVLTEAGETTEATW
jgi:hypothetical protein